MTNNDVESTGRALGKSNTVYCGLSSISTPFDTDLCHLSSGSSVLMLNGEKWSDE